MKEELTDSSVEEEKKANNEDFDLSDISHSKSIGRLLEAKRAAIKNQDVKNYDKVIGY